MFNKIEDLYKKQSPYNRIIKKIFWTYIIIMPLLWILNIGRAYILMILVLVSVFFIMKKICEKELNAKLYFNFDKKDNKGLSLGEIINNKEKELFQKFLKDEKKYNKKALECILNHYRTYIKPKIVGDNFWAIIAIVISIALAFVTKEGFNINSFEKSLPYLISIVLASAIIYFSIKKFAEVKKVLKGEDGIYERLEIIFSELYVEYEEEKIEVNKNSKIKKQAKSKKQK